MRVVNGKAYYNKIKQLNISHYAGEILYYTHAPLRRVEKKILDSIKTGVSILDVGCGSGRFSIGAAQFGHPVFGVDITPDAIKAAKHKAKELRLDNVHFVVGDMIGLPFRDNEYDYVFCPRFSINAVATFEYRRRAIQEMIRVVKPGGNVYIESFNKFYLGRGPLFLLKNIFRDVWRASVITFCWLFRKQYTGLLPGDIIYESNKVVGASKGYTHLPTVFELTRMTPARISCKFYSIPQITGEHNLDLLKYCRYSIWVLLTKPRS